jgi:hypothetical protein
VYGNKLPLVALIVRGIFPRESEGVVANVRTDEPPPVIEFVLQVAVDPAGAPVAVKLTVPINPSGLRLFQ